MKYFPTLVEVLVYSEFNKLCFAYSALTGETCSWAEQGSDQLASQPEQIGATGGDEGEEKHIGADRRIL